MGTLELAWECGGLCLSVILNLSCMCVLRGVLRSEVGSAAVSLKGATDCTFNGI